MLRKLQTYIAPNSKELINEAILKQEPINNLQSDGLSPLDFAALAGNLEAVNYLISQGARSPSLLYWTVFGSAQNPTNAKDIMKWMFAQANFDELFFPTAKEHVLAALGAVNFDKLNQNKLLPSVKADFHGYTAYHYFVASGLNFVSETIQKDCLKKIDLNFSGPPPNYFCTVGTLLAQLGKFDLMTDIYKANLKKIDINIDAKIDSNLLYPPYRHVNPPLGFYLAETNHSELVYLVVTKLKMLNKRYFVDFTYDSNGLTFMHLLFQKNKSLALLLESPQFSPFAKTINYEIRVNDETSPLYGKSINDLRNQTQDTVADSAHSENNNNAVSNPPNLGHELVVNEGIAKQIASQQQLITALQKDNINLAKAAVEKGANPHILTDEGFLIHQAAKYGSLEVVSYLDSLNVEWSLGELGKHAHLFLAVCQAPRGAKRQRMLQWLSEDNNFKKIESGVTRGHFAAACGNIDASNDSPRCHAGLNDFDYLVFAGLASVVDPTAKEQILQKIDGHKLENGIFENASHFILLSLQKDIESLTYAMHNNKNFDINEVYTLPAITPLGKDSTVSIFISLLKAGKIKEVIQYINNNPCKIKLKTCYKANAIDTFLKYLVENKHWDIIELILSQELRKAKETQKFPTNYYLQQFTTQKNETSKLSCSIVYALIANKQFAMLERLWEINSGFILWTEGSPETTILNNDRPNTICLFIEDDKGSQSLLNMINKEQEKKIFNYFSASVEKKMAFYKRTKLFEKYIEFLTNRLNTDSYNTLIVLDDIHKAFNKSIRSMLSDTPKLLNKINVYNSKAAECNKQAVIKGAGSQESKPSKRQIQASTQENSPIFTTKPFIELEALKEACIKLFGQKFQISHYEENKPTKTANLVFTGDESDLKALKKAFEKVWKIGGAQLGEDNNELNNNKTKTCIVDQVPIGLIQNSFIDQPHLKFKDLFKQKNKHEKSTDHYVDNRNRVREKFTTEQLAAWQTYLHAAFAYSNVVAVIADKNEQLGQHFKISIANSIWQVSTYVDDKTYHKQKEKYEVDQIFINEKILRQLTSEIESVADIKGEYPDFTVIPYSSAPNDNIHGNVYKRMTKHLTKLPDDTPKDEDINDNNSQTTDHVTEIEEDNTNNAPSQSEPPKVDPIVEKLEAVKFNTLTNTGKLRTLLSMIVSGEQTFMFIDKHTKATGNKKWKVELPLKGLKGLGGDIDPYNYFRYIQIAINNEFPNFMSVTGTDEKMEILFDFPTVGVNTFVGKLGNIITCYDDQIYLKNLLSEKEETVPNENFVELKKTGQDKAITKRFNPQITEKIILRVLMCLKDDTMLTYHLNEMAAFALQPNRESDHTYYAYLIHLQVVTVLLSKKQGFVDSIFRALRNLVRHAYIETAFDRKNIYDLLDPLIIAVAKVNEFKDVKANSLNLFTKNEKLGLERILNLVRRYENEILTDSIGKEMDKSKCVQEYKQLISPIRSDEKLSEPLKKQITLMLCSLIGETEKKRPYKDIYKILGHKRSEMIEKDFNEFIDEIYNKFASQIDNQHPIITAPTPSISSAQ